GAGATGAGAGYYITPRTGAGA
nr:Chain C, GAGATGAGAGYYITPRTGAGA [synthetic construct]6PXU_D Chain D, GAGATGAGAGYYITPRTGAGA [synthetic construct]